MSTKSKKRRNRFIVAGILLGSLVLAFVLVRGRSAPPRSAPPVRAPTVETAQVAEVVGPLIVRGSGTVRPKAEIDLAAQVPGRVSFVSRSMVSGGRISAGEVLLRIEDADYVNAVQQARAQVAQDSVGVLEALEEARIAEAEYGQFLRRESRNGSPGTNGVVSAAEASVLTLRGPQLQAAQASLASSTARLADAELALNRTALRAPFDGVVRTESVDVGAYAAPGQNLARLMSTEEVEVKIPLSNADASLLPGLWDVMTSEAPSLSVKIISSFGQGRFRWEGYVHRAEAALDEQTRTIDVVIRVSDPFQRGIPMEGSEVGTVEPPPLLIGQFVDVEMDGIEGEYLVVPRRAVRPGNEVWVVEEGRIRIVPVEILQRNDGQAFLSGELWAGQRVVVEGIDLATEGMAVQDRGTGS